MQLGNKIRKLRKKKKLTIKELAKRSELSTSMISQIERDQIGISVASLWKIAQALDVYIGYFFTEKTDKNDLIVKSNQRKKIELADSNAAYELLTPDLTGKIEFLRLIIEPGESSKRREQISHKGEECGVVLQGKLLIKLGKEKYILEQGDSIRVDSTIPHRYINNGEITSISIWAITPPKF